MLPYSLNQGAHRGVKDRGGTWQRRCSKEERRRRASSQDRGALTYSQHTYSNIHIGPSVHSTHTRITAHMYTHVHTCTHINACHTRAHHTHLIKHTRRHTWPMATLRAASQVPENSVLNDAEISASVISPYSTFNPPAHIHTPYTHHTHTSVDTHTW